MTLAIIGGTGLTRMSGLEISRREVVHTPFGEPSSPLIHGVLEGREVTFLPRHGSGHTIPPHQINYRANLWALKHVGATQIIGVAATGGIGAEMAPGTVVIPDQLIDYTWGRAHTYFDRDLTQVTHVDFTTPYCSTLREQLIKSGRTAGIAPVEAGTYGVTQGPRLETAQEIQRMSRDGCDLVGMTGMPEAGLAREINLCYASCSVVANWAAGITDRPITMEEIEANLKVGMTRVESLLRATMQAPESTPCPTCVE